MNKRKPVSLEDFPRFTVTSMRKDTPDKDGLSRFELVGGFDREIVRTSEVTWFWLLFGNNNWLCVTWESYDRQTFAAVLSGDKREVPDLVGETLFYLDPYWQAFHVWMVLDPDWGWQRTQFHALDAVAQNFVSEDVSIVNGRKVTNWTRLERAHGQGHTTRYGPSDDDASFTPASVPRIVPGGWTHEHCELCHAHIDDGNFGYRDPDQRWMCEACYEKYVIARDLSFVVEL